MARSFGFVARGHGCMNCSCGNHRGCVVKPGGTYKGTKIPFYPIKGTAVENCPCIKAADAAVKEGKRRLAAEKKTRQLKKAALEKSEKSLRIRLVALEKAMWGQSYEGKVAVRRPAALQQSSELKSVGKRKRE